ncbi:MAG TPA: V-type ATP synthase subunit K [Anaerohalosphaeraceae bacterium]|jgi:V/A-type H+-transporting ATPase subunit K|nr:V-type ATP synthase subunit K [Anaerohalosphaeraceae bacterium]HRT50785.1 V-type ATP synthase subunit K [Anaerohalosphaeraceae bacterium]HRT86821.1 V-type ATP synthase subunit K [Anaerohalosphaeraceae bacterium]
MGIETLGLAFSIAGAAVAVFLSGIGSSIGLAAASRAATGVLSEKPERYGTLMLLVVLPSTQGIYGFVVGLFVMIKLNMFGGDVTPVEWYQGLAILAACLPVGIGGLVSAIHQGRTGAAGILMTAKRPEMAFKAGVVFAAMIELYAILGFLISLLILLMGINVGTAAA